MNNLDEHVGLSIAKSYIADRLEYVETRRLLKQIKPKRRPRKFHCAICHTLVSIGHMLVAFGRRLERFDMVLRESKV